MDMLKEAAPDLYARYKKRGSLVSKYETQDQKYNLSKWSYKALQNCLYNAYVDKSRPLLIFGKAGIGKSDVVRQFSEAAANKEKRTYVVFSDLTNEEKQDVLKQPEQYFVFWDIRGSQVEPDQVTGIPDLEKAKQQGYLTYSVPEWVHFVTRPGISGLLFLDEINRSSRAVLNSFLQLTLDRVVSNRKISKNVMIVAAGNLGSEFSTSTETLDPADIGRFTAGVLVADINGWTEYAMKNGINDYIISFAKANPIDNFYKDPESENSQYVSPRNLKAASRRMDLVIKRYEEADAKNEDVSEDIYTAIGEAVAGETGPEYANRFIEYIKAIHSFDWAEILQQSDEDKIKEMSIDQSWALVNFIHDNLLAKYEEARSKNNKRQEESVCKEFVTIVKGLPADQLAFLIKKLKISIMKEHIPGTSLKETAQIFKEFITTSHTIAKSVNAGVAKKLADLIKSMASVN